MASSTGKRGVLRRSTASAGARVGDCVVRAISPVSVRSRISGATVIPRRTASTVCETS
jgi:hypothetical protein